MSIVVRECPAEEIAELREAYREEMNCQIIHDSIHSRPGWTVEHVLELDGVLAGYASLAVKGPWSESNAIYEFWLRPEFRPRAFESFTALRQHVRAAILETQSNGILLPVMLHTFTVNIRAEAVLFEDGITTHLAPPGAGFRACVPEDSEQLRRLQVDPDADWVVTLEGELAGSGGVLYHYNRPYGDLYMGIAEPFRRRGLGAYLVQELKAACREGGSTPAARCNIANVASQRTLQKAGFVPCGNLVVGDLPNA